MDYYCPTTKAIISAIRRDISLRSSPDGRLQDTALDPTTVSTAPDLWASYDADYRDVARSYLSKNLLKKFYDEAAHAVAPKKDLEEEALTKFLDVERRLGTMGDDGWFGVTNDLIALARENLRRLLGRFKPDEFSDSLSLSNGASTRLRRKDAHPVFKMGGKPHVTRNCQLLAAHLLWYTPSLKRTFTRRFGELSTPDEWMTVVDGSEQFSVPKTSTSVRLCAKEPEMNLLLQSGIGKMIRRRLKRIGINLNDDTTNQRYALIGSRTGSLATLDLSSASDSVSMFLIRELLPEDWYRWIFYTRSPCMKLLSGRTIRLEKVSTMGNGFTFELESAIFWALAEACIRYSGCPDRRLTVFGDDIVMHHEPAALLAGLFPILGFEVNRDKSFLTGPFRESCGGHYWRGQDIKPFYLHKGYADKRTRPPEVAFLLNGYLNWSMRVGHEPDFRMVRWIIKTYAPDLPVVPADSDPRSGLFGPPLQGVWFSLKRSGYVYKQYSVGSEKRTKVLSSGTALAVWFLLGSVPGRSDRLRDRTTVVHADAIVDKRLRTSVTSKWEYPEYPPSWMASLFE